MLCTYTSNDTGVALAVDAAIPFDTNAVVTGCTATHEPGSVAIKLNRPGFYQINFNADATATTAAGIITVQMERNGIDVIGAEASAFAAAVAEPVNLHFTFIIRVCPNCEQFNANIPAYLTFINDGIAATYTEACVCVTKLA